MAIAVVLSILLLGGFIGVGIRKFGLLRSYSAYASQWSVKVLDLPIWSVVTFIAALLIVPVMVEVGNADPFQCLGFFAPVYLIIVSLTPNWETDKRQGVVHRIGAVICAVLAFAWLLLVCHMWYVVLAASLLVLAMLIVTRRPDAYIFWGEMIMFISTYVSLLIMQI